MRVPLADKLRPQNIEDVVGQKHLITPGKALYNMIETGNIFNMIFYGPSGTGKTTLANIAAKRANKKLFKLNATTASVSDIRDVISQLDGFEAMDGVVLYLDEIQNFNKKQQQSLLEYIENGKITLIASTTENPYFYIYNAILSRCAVFEFKPIEADDIEKAILRGVSLLEGEGLGIKLEDAALKHIAACAGGDVRRALNTLDICSMIAKTDKKGKIKITLENAEECTQKQGMRYDRDGDSHYDILSAFQKSIRGSDADAALHYMARLCEAGDMMSICRRLLVIAAEDIGMAYPAAISIVKACVDSAFQLGLPEARIPLAEAVVLLATAPKSNSVITAIDAAIGQIKSMDTGDIPLHLKDAHYSGAQKMGRGLEYKYPHSFKNNYVKQQYLPDNIKDQRYYSYGNNKHEQAMKQYWDKIKNL